MFISDLTASIALQRGHKHLAEFMFQNVAFVFSWDYNGHMITNVPEIYGKNIDQTKQRPNKIIKTFHNKVDLI